VQEVVRSTKKVHQRKGREVCTETLSGIATSRCVHGQKKGKLGKGGASKERGGEKSGKTRRRYDSCNVEKGQESWRGRGKKDQGGIVEAEHLEVSLYKRFR